MARALDDEDEVLYWLTLHVACFEEPDPSIWAKFSWIEATTWRGDQVAHSPLAGIEPLVARPLVAVVQLAWIYIDTDPQGQEASLDWCLQRVHGIRFWSSIDARAWGPGSVLPYESRWDLVDAKALEHACAEGLLLAQQLDAILRGPANPPFYVGY
ncbi:MAG TPA: hypothetical protein VLB44_26130 [Kofleriaceae bacterium]|nr:hypothetical protein [Kofleriaceae bacterium]